jgi:hypothetical protein
VLWELYVWVCPDRAGLHETFVTDLADQCYRCGRRGARTYGAR